MISSTTPYKLAEIIRDTWPGLYNPYLNKKNVKIEMDYPRIRSNFQILNKFLVELQTNMNSAIPEIYFKLEETDNQEVGQGFISDLFWSAFNLITTIETLEGKEVIAWFLGAIVQDVHDHIDQYPDLNGEIASLYTRMTTTITHLKDDKISPVVDNPEAHLDDTYTYNGKTMKVSEFNNFDFVYASSGYNLALNAVSKECKSQALKKCFPYWKWKIGFWFAENPQTNPCDQCNWGCDDWADVRELYEDMNQPIFDGQGNKIANDIYDWVKQLYKNAPARFYVIEPISAPNVRIGNYEDDYKTKYPNGAFINEYCLVWGRDDFLKDWKDFPDDVATWMFDDVNPDGFVDRNDFYYNWNLDAANCMYKRQYPPDPNIILTTVPVKETWLEKIYKWIFNS